MADDSMPMAPCAPDAGSPPSGNAICAAPTDSQLFRKELDVRQQAIRVLFLQDFAKVVQKAGEVQLSKTTPPVCENPDCSNKGIQLHPFGSSRKLKQYRCPSCDQTIRRGARILPRLSKLQKTHLVRFAALLLEGKTARQAWGVIDDGSQEQRLPSQNDQLSVRWKKRLEGHFKEWLLKQSENDEVKAEFERNLDKIMRDLVRKRKKLASTSNPPAQKREKAKTQDNVFTAEEVAILRRLIERERKSSQNPSAPPRQFSLKQSEQGAPPKEFGASKKLEKTPKTPNPQIADFYARIRARYLKEKRDEGREN